MSRTPPRYSTLTLLVLLAAAPGAGQQLRAGGGEKEKPSFSVVAMGLDGKFGEPSVRRTNRKGTVAGTVSSNVGDDIRSDAFLDSTNMMTSVCKCSLHELIYM